MLLPLHQQSKMVKKREHKPASVQQQPRLGDRPAFVSKRMHQIPQVSLVIIGIAFLRWLQYKRAVVNPQLKSDLVNASYSEFNPNAWGSYRPQSYFGLKSRRPQAPIFGMAWYSHRNDSLLSNMRHWCNQDDGVHFMWEAADGKSMGKQRITDKRLNITTEWFNRGNSWSAQVGVARNDSFSTSVVFYFALQDLTHSMRPMFENDELHRLWVHIPQLSDFHLEIDISARKGFKRSDIALRQEPQFDLTNISDLLMHGLQLDGHGFTSLNREVFGNSENPNFFAVHFDVPENAKILIEFRDESEPALPEFETEFTKKLTAFDAQLQESFFSGKDTRAEIPPETYQIGKTALSNMLGGIGYWDGYARMKSKHWSADRVDLYGPLELFSAVPSRPFFPRGFIWDEGFHNLLIRKFDPELSLDIVSSWLNTMNIEGWIPREMILGNEAEAKVPQEFLVQSDRVANPPVFFYLMDKFVHNPEFISTHRQRILSLYPRLKQWYLWLRDSQQGPLKGSFQWQGRNGTTNFELNPKTLPSGLDDFPRASHPTPNEYHLDLRSWLAVASRVIRYLAELAQNGKFISEADEDQRLFNDFSQLNKLHWSENAKRYCDYGLHSKNVRLETVAVPNKEPVVVRKVVEKPVEGFVEDVYGYVNLFSFLLKLLPVESEQLTEILRDLNNPKSLWSPYGLRSVSASCPYYQKRNTKHDPPYWRGDIWININYMALEALKHYAELGGGPISALCEQLYSSLKQNVVTNIVREFKRTGQFWEHYSDKTGEGAGTRPFTGWTALVFAIMTDNYD